MRHLLARGSAVVLVVAAALSAACSTNDPMAPQAPSAARTPSSAATGPNHYLGTGTVSGAVGGAATGDATTNGGYMVTWGRGDQSTSQQGQ